MQAFRGRDGNWIPKGFNADETYHYYQHTADNVVFKVPLTAVSTQQGLAGAVSKMYGKEKKKLNPNKVVPDGLHLLPEVRQQCGTGDGDSGDSGDGGDGGDSDAHHPPRAWMLTRSARLSFTQVQLQHDPRNRQPDHYHHYHHYHYHHYHYHSHALARRRRPRPARNSSRCLCAPSAMRERGQRAQRAAWRGSVACGAPRCNACIERQAWPGPASSVTLRRGLGPHTHA